MIQRKCGTCRYFEEGGIAASGWCRHPERQDLQHMVLVRKTELACRDGWDHDLWEPVEAGGAGPRPMASAVTAGRTGQSDQALSNGTQTLQRDPGERYPEHTDDSERVSFNRSETATSDSDEAGPSGSQFGSRRNRASLGAWSPALDPNSQETDSQLDEVRDETFSTRGLRPDADWRRQLSEMRRQTSQTHESVPKPQFFERDEEPGSEPPHATEEPEPQGEESPASQFGASNWGVPESSLDAHRPNERHSEPVQQSGLTEPFEFAPHEDEEQPADLPDPGDNGAFADPVDDQPNDVFEDDVDELPSPSRDGSTDLPMAATETQCCRTCRDFRPTDGGQRGWCNNPFAFESRQQVNGTDLACRGTFGNWWSPSDDWWIERADISHHSTPTPLVEALIREIRDRNTRPLGSTQKLRRS